MKQNEIHTYKNFGTIQESRDEDGKKIYLFTHTFFNETHDETTLKGVREMLEYYERKAQEIKAAIRVLSGSGYKVFKEIA